MNKIVSPTGKPETVKPVQGNAGIEARYRKKLDQLVAEMNDSILYWLSAAYKANPPEALATDESPAMAMRSAMSKVARRWQAKFDKGADKLADWFARETRDYSDGTLQAILKEAGFTVKFQNTAAINDVLQAIIGENVGLIKSIASRNLTQVQTVVMQSVQQGRDLATVTKNLQHEFGVTKRRAALIARDQNNKATATITKTRQQQLGITQAKWRHSGGGKEPRQSHLHADGKVYDIEKGMYLDGKWTWPGVEINCFPADSVVEFAAGCKKLWRRWYSGNLTKIVTASGKTINATPNHPILTKRGWLAIKDVAIGDDVVKVADQVFDGIEADVKAFPSTFGQVFDAVSRYVNSVASIAGFQFHGDASDGEVETIDVDGFLPSEVEAALCQKVCELFFANANHVFVANGLEPDSALYAAGHRLFSSSESIVRGFSTLLPLLKIGSGHADAICLGLSSDLHSAFDKAKADASSSCAVAIGNLQLAQSGLVVGNDLIIRELLAIWSRASIFWNRYSESADSLGKKVCIETNNRSSLFQGHAFSYQLDRVVDVVSLGGFAGHVYNLETGLSWYTSDSYIAHNCRCTAQPIIPGFIE